MVLLVISLVANFIMFYAVVRMDERLQVAEYNAKMYKDDAEYWKQALEAKRNA